MRLDERSLCFLKKSSNLHSLIDCSTINALLYCKLYQCFLQACNMYGGRDCLYMALMGLSSAMEIVQWLDLTDVHSYGDYFSLWSVSRILIQERACNFLCPRESGILSVLSVVHGTQLSAGILKGGWEPRVASADCRVIQKLAWLYRWCYVAEGLQTS